MDVNLKPEIEQLIESEVKSGRVRDRNEFLNRAVYHHVVARDLSKEYPSEEIDRLMDEGLQVSIPQTCLTVKMASANSVLTALTAVDSGRESALRTHPPRNKRPPIDLGFRF